MKTNAQLKLVILSLAAVLGAGACNDTTVTPTTPTTADIFFTSQLMVQGLTSRTFKVAKAGEIKVLFTSLLPETSATVNVALGTFNGTTCSPTTTINAAAGSTTPVITTTLAAGDYCITLSDPGALTKTNDFSITVTIPAS